MLLFVVFTAQNAEVVEVRFLLWKLEMSRAIVLIGLFGLGLAIGWGAKSVSHMTSRD